MRFYRYFIFVLAMSLDACHSSAPDEPDPAPTRVPLTKNPSSAYRSPEETMRSIHLPAGYHLQLVASEPDIQEPVAITWDGNGRMYVAEMRSYMKDINGTGEKFPECRITRLEDTDGDGKMDKHTVFIDSLVLPRMMLALDDRIVVNETYSNNLWSYRDTNNDGVADEKKMVYHNDTPDEANLEHQRSGLIWNIDNWIYTTRSPARFRVRNGQLVADTIYSTSGQWGLAHDDYGKLFFSSAGGENPALDFQQAPQYGRMGIDSQLENNFEAVWPIIATPDVEGGKIRLREDSTLNHFTASCGQTIFRGDALPESLRGDLLICEPAGRLIRRAKVTQRNGITFLKNAYDSVEFLASTDMNFRPINLDTGPDGCLYIVDMYHGIIQEGNWTREGSYLRPQILARHLDEHIGRGRIYRLVHDGYTPGPRPHLLADNNAALVSYLSHPNGWWRDNAQKLLVLRNDPASVPALEKLISETPSSNHSSNLGRLHALWTLEGMHSLKNDILIAALNDPDPEIRKAAIRIGEPFLSKPDDQKLWSAIQKLARDTSATVRIQLALSMRYAAKERSSSLLNELAADSSHSELLAKAIRESHQEGDTSLRQLRRATANMDEEDKRLVFSGAAIFAQLCAVCHGADGKGLSTKIAPALSGAAIVNGDKNILIRVLLHGLSGPVDGHDYPGTMLALSANTDTYIASVASYIRNAMGNDARAIGPEDVEKLRKETQGRNKPWTMKELAMIKTK